MAYEMKEKEMKREEKFGPIKAQKTVVLLKCNKVEKWRAIKGNGVQTCAAVEAN